MKQRMTFLLKSVFVAFLFLLFFSEQSFATHVQGGEITMSCLGGNQYELRLALYRDCAGINAPTSARVMYSSVSCGISQSINLNKVAGTGQEVTPICPSASSVCSGGSLPGVEEYVYTGIITLPQCSDWVVSYTLNARNNAIGTINNPGSQRMHIESELDNLNFPCNNSPIFTNKPVPFICVGQQYCFNNGATDIDGDSLSYAMVIPKTGPTSNVAYIPPYSATQPLASTPMVTIDPLNGDICMTPTQIQVTVFAVLVSEWRNGVKIGEIRRDIQIRTITCNNDNPFLNGINNTGSYDMNACVGSPITFNIPSFDNDAGDNLTLAWNNTISGATFDPGSGARPQATFTWSPSLNDVGSVPHCFTVTVADDNCPIIGTQSYSFCITVGGFTTTKASKDVICLNTDGIASVVAANAPGPFSYLWTPGGQTTDSISGLSAGVYRVTTTDTIGCFIEDTITINSTDPSLASITSFTDVTCNGDNDGSVTASLTGLGLVAPLTYSWQPAVTGNLNKAENLAPGNYRVIITDSQGCTDTISQMIAEPAPLAINTSFGNTGCFGGSTGFANATASAGTAPYTYLWMPGAFNKPLISSLSIGTYVVTVTDSNNCTVIDSVTIDQPLELDLTAVVTNANCGQSDGSATVNGSGGFAPYTYSWSNGQNGINATNLVAGTYTVTMTDANFCTKTFPVTIGNNVGPSVKIVDFNNVTCNGLSDGNVTVQITGGSSPYTYLWSNGQATPTASNLLPGLYSLVITDDNGCSATIDTTITEPAILTNNFIFNDPACFGEATGSILTNVLGGTTPYKYVWSALGNPTTDSIINLAAGRYTVTITDANNCAITQSVTLVEPTKVSTVISATPASCFGSCDGTAETVTSNGVPPYTYSWNDPLNQTSDTAKFLCAGNYQVNIVDRNGCASQAVAIVNEPSGLMASITSKKDLICFEDCIGFAQVAATGGTAPYSYSWSNGDVTATTSGLCAGGYACTITDAKGCTKVVPVIITQPKELIATISGTDIRCFGNCDGTGNINFSGGTSPYSFLWSPGLQAINNPIDLCSGQNIAEITDANGCSVTDTMILIESLPILLVDTNFTDANCLQANGSACVVLGGGLPPYSYVWNDPGVSKNSCITNVFAGSYTVDATDAAGCLKTVTINIDDIAGPTVTLDSHTDLLCFGDTNGTATTTITAGVSPYSFLWTPGNQIIQNPTNLNGGVHSLTVTDAAGCKSSISVNILEPTDINTAILSSTDVTCFGLCNGDAVAAAVGGTGVLSYLWDDPAAQNSAAAINLCAGNYNVSVTDENNCIKMNKVNIVEPDELVIDSNSFQNLKCFNDYSGSIFTSVSGGTPFYTFNWTPNISSSSTANGLPIGNYSLQVVDQNGCTVNENWVITQPNQLVGLPTQIDATCGLNNGSATIAASGGTSPYSYLWNDPSFQTTSTAVNLLSGNYMVNLIDANNCKFIQNTVLSNIPGPAIDTLVSAPVTCFGGNDGTATVTLDPGLGTAPFTYAWNPSPQSLSSISGLLSGTYSVTVTDGNGCIAGGNVRVDEPPLLSLFNSSDDTICFGDTISIYGQGSGGTPPYTYTWVGALNLLQVEVNEVFPTTTTTYTVSLTDANGCVAAPSDITITVLPGLNVIATDVTVCEGDSVAVSCIATGGNGNPYVYNWDNGDSNQVQMVLPTMASSPMDYIVTVNDGCSAPAVDTATISLNTVPIIDSIVGTDALCFGGSTGSANVFVNNAITYGPHTYDWGGVTQPFSLINGLSAGKYVVNITDKNGCVVKDSILIDQPDSLILSVVEDSICYGAVGQISASTSGGTAPYIYKWTGIAGGGFGPGPHLLSPLISSEYTVRATDRNGCTVGPVNVMIKVGAPLTVFASDVSVCENDTVKISANVSGGGTPYNYSWSNGVYSQDQLVAVSQTDVSHIVTVTDGCSTPASDTSFISVNSKPNGEIMAFPKSGCAPLLVNFVAISSDGSQYYWNYGNNGSVISTSLDTTKYTYLNSGSYDVGLTVVNLLGCSTLVDSLNYINVHPNPIADFSMDLNPVSMFNPEVQFTDLSYFNIKSWSWDFSGLGTSIVQSPSYLFPAVAGDYDVSLKVVDSNGCVDSTIKTLIVKPEWSFYVPNSFIPNGDGLNDVFNPSGFGISDLDYSFIIFDRWGELIFETTNLFAPWDGTYKGTMVKQDTYIWKASFRDIFGNLHSKIGRVTLLK